MSPMKAWHCATSRRVRALVAACCVVALGGCAAQHGRSDGSIDGSTDGSIVNWPDTGVDRDSGQPHDSGMSDSGPPDSGPPPIRRMTCEACERHSDCAPGSYCIALQVGGRACAPGCNPDIPNCPRSFSCILDLSTGVDTEVCAPVGGACCVDEDGDGYGVGVGCSGSDCDDADESVNPGEAELCNGIDDDCDGTADDPPTDCLSGRCYALTDGTYESIQGAECVDGECIAGSATPCGLYTCEDGGESGNRCATTCAPDGTDDDAYCIAGAHCDDGVCVMDEPNGGMCDEDSDCVAGHCDNGFCCTTGTCCSTRTDCPGGGDVTRLCESPATCQGSRGETECVDFQCRTMDGIPDDTACGPTTLAKNCGLYDPVYCTGASDQPEPECPTSCTTDAECVDAAHCELGACVPDRPAGGSCSRPQDCQDGLFCVDGVCCTSACNGTCEACNLPLTVGTCTPIPAMQDPAGECPGFSCAGYYTGFGAGEDACYHRQDVSDATAACNGARACIDQATLCSLQPRGTLQIDCHNTCQSPIAGTCTGTTPGACRNLDDPSDRVTCGTGECMREVQRCVGGLPQTCTPGTPVAETCNGLDDDCDGTPDDGPGASLCPAAPGAATYTCTSGECSFTCLTGRVNLNGDYSDGCECTNPSHGTSCATLTPLTGIGAGSSMSVTGFIAPGEEDWFSASFPFDGTRGPHQGRPQIRLTGESASNFVLDFFRNCSTDMSCGEGSPTGVGSYSFVDEASSGDTAYSVNGTAWPSTVIFRVRRVVTSGTRCEDATYTVTISR